VVKKKKKKLWVTPGADAQWATWQLCPQENLFCRNILMPRHFFHKRILLSDMTLLHQSY